MENIYIKIRILFIAIISIMFASCKPTADESAKTTTITKYVGCSAAAEGTGQCIRWMDRKIYLAFSTGANPNRNNEFQKQKIKDALQNEIGSNTILGRNYFTFTEVDESLLNPIIEVGLAQSEYRSFILIWDDASFNDFVVNQLGGNVPDLNAITVINSAFKRKFFMIFKASCFNSNATCNSITTNGINGLIARQFGLLTGLPPEKCLNPLDTTCPVKTMHPDLPSDNQWNDTNKSQWFAEFNNILELIYNNPNYYDEYVPAS